MTKQAGVDQQRDSFATWFFDFDNDGWPDIFSAGYYVDSMDDVGAFELGLPYHAETPRLYRNNHDGTFTDVSKQMHLDRAILVMGANFGDLDNDGWLDIYLGDGEPAYEALLPNRMFRNNGGKDFQDVTTNGGFGHLQKGHAVAFGDLENNGSEDVFEEMGGAFPGDTYQSVLYQNPLHGNDWVTLELEGVETNRAAFGARICVTRERGGGQTAHLSHSRLRIELWRESVAAAHRAGQECTSSRRSRSSGRPRARLRASTMCGPTSVIGCAKVTASWSR